MEILLTSLAAEQAQARQAQQLIQSQSQQAQQLIQSQSQARQLALLQDYPRYFELLKTVESSSQSLPQQLFEAIINNDLYLVLWLELVKRVSIFSCLNAENFSLSSLSVALKNGHPLLAQYFINRHVPITQADVIMAIKNNQLANLKLMVNHGFKLEQFNSSILPKFYPLVIAVDHGYLDIVKFLIENGLRVNFGDEAAIKAATFNGDLPMVKLLIELGANPSHQYDICYCFAAEKGHLEVIRFLYNYKKDDLDLCQNALNYALAAQQVAVVQFLMESGVKLKAPRVK